MSNLITNNDNCLPTTELGSIIHSTNDYSVRVCRASDDETVILYGVFNDKTGVRELEFSTLPNAIGHCSGLEKANEAARLGETGLMLEGNQLVN